MLAAIESKQLRWISPTDQGGEDYQWMDGMGKTKTETKKKKPDICGDADTN